MLGVGKTALAFAAALALAGCESVADEPVEPTRSPPGEPQLVYTVDDVQIAILKKTPAGIVITAKGTTRTAGWDNPELRPLQTFAPEQGIRSFTFVATGPRPDELVAQVITPIEATYTLDPLPGDVKQIKVMSETDEMTVDVYPK
jgi:ABC-type Fe3+-hydroxamate transport system substrate-binding protein